MELILQEQMAPGFRVDRETKTIHDVCLLGPESRNGWKYSATVIAEAAPRYDRRPVYFNHIKSGSSRDVRDVAGRIASPRLKDGRLYGDIKCIGRNGDMLMELAESGVDGIGMSHLTDETSTVIAKTKTVVKIGNIKSVDVVDSPATTKTLKEDCTLELKEQLSSLLEGTKPVIERLEAIYKACAVEFKLEEQALPASPTIEDVETLREYAKDKPALTKLIEQHDSLQRDKWATEAIAEAKIPSTAATVNVLKRCASKELMVEQCKVLKEAIEASKPAPVQKGREASKDAKALPVDDLVAALKS